MSNYKTFKDYISENDNELLKYAPDNFSQLPQITSSINSKCDRAQPFANSNDLVEYDEKSEEKSLSESETLNEMRNRV